MEDYKSLYEAALRVVRKLIDNPDKDVDRLIREASQPAHDCSLHGPGTCK